MTADRIAIKLLSDLRKSIDELNSKRMRPNSEIHEVWIDLPILYFSTFDGVNYSETSLDDLHDGEQFCANINASYWRIVSQEDKSNVFAAIRELRMTIAKFCERAENLGIDMSINLFEHGDQWLMVEII